MRKLRQKHVLPLLFGVAIVFLGISFVLFLSEKKSFEKILSEDEALFIIAYQGEQERWFKGRVVDGMTFLDVLRVSARAGNFDFKVNSQIESIDGFSNSKESQWRCYIDRHLIRDLNQEIFPRTKIRCEYK